MTNQLPLRTLPFILQVPLDLRSLLVLICAFFIALFSYSQGKGKKNGNGNSGGNNNQVTLLACIQPMENGLIHAYFGYDNPTGEIVEVDPEDSYVFLNDKIQDDSENGVKKLPGITTFLPGLHEKAFPMVFNANGHAKWTVEFNGNKKTKIRVTSKSDICPDDEVIFQVFGGAGKVFTKIGPECTALANGNAGDIPSEIIFQINSEDEVLIEIIPDDCNTCLQDVLNILQAPPPGGFGRTADDFIVDPATVIAKGYAAIDVYFPINRLFELNDLTSVNFVRPLYDVNLQVGAVDTQGDTAMLTNIVRESFVTRDAAGNPEPVIGTGIKIAALSDSFDKANPPGQAAIDVGNGDLPGPGNPNGYTTPVDVLKDLPTEGSDEGRAMLQIIHDVAPGAQLAFRTAVLSQRDMALGIDNLAAAGYQVLVDDVNYPLSPAFMDGEVAKAIKNFTDNGGTYITSSGNFADVAEQGIFTNSGPGVPLPSFLTPGTTAHVFDGGSDFLREITVDIGTYFIVLQWDEDLASQDNSTGAGTDLDIYVMAPNGIDVLVNTNRANPGGDAVEAMVFQSTENDAQASIMITSADGPAPPNLAFRYIVYRANGLDLIGAPGASTVSGHAMTTEAITVGAVNHTEVQNLPLDPEQFSSFAGTLPNGTTLEIDIAAPDGVDVNLPFFGTDTDGNGFNNFFGTSASAPHVAAVYGLLLSAEANWYPSGLPINRLQLFQDTAIPVTTGGGVLQAGPGFLDAEAAFKQIASQTAVLISLEVNPDQAGEGEPEPVLGIDPTIITITGKYISEEPTVILREGEEDIELDVISSSDTEIVALVPPISGGPSLLSISQSITETGNDGGESNPLPLFDDGTVVLNIIANNLPGEEGAPIEYGDDFEYSFTVEGLPADVFIGEDLPEVILASPADALAPFPDVNTYVIFPSFDLENASPGQIAALEGYRVNFVTGLLQIVQKDLSITPEPEPELVYGEPIVLTLTYEYDDTNVADENKAAFNALVMESHASDFFPVNTLSVLNRFNAIVNADVFSELQGGSWMATENSLLNRFNAIVNDAGDELMGLVNVEIEAFEDYLTNRFNAIVNTNRFNAIVNGEDLLTGQVTINNRFNAIVNDSGLGDDENDFSQVFAVLNANDEPADPNDGGTVDTFYALNFITGLNATGEEAGQESQHYSYPGAFLDPIAANFNINYNSSTMMIGKASLVALTTSLSSPVPYGTDLTQEDFASDFFGFVYGETVEDVFPPDPNDETNTPVIPYYFVDESNNEFELGELIPVGIYEIRVRDPLNYSLVYEEVGILEIQKAELVVSADNLEFQYGIVLDANDIIKTDDLCDGCEIPVINGYVGEDSDETVFPEGIPYYFIDTADQTQEYDIGDAIPVGTYLIRIRGQFDNYNLVYAEDHGILTITPAPLNVCIDDVEIREGSTLFPEDINAQFTGFIFDEAVYFDTFNTVFPNGVTYLVDIGDGVLVELTSEGLELDEGTYTILVKEDDIRNYFVVYGTTCSGNGTVIVSTCGNVPFLDFSNSTLISETSPLSEGSVYKFSQVWPGDDNIPALDALVTITIIESAQIGILDRNNGADNAFFQPEIRFWKDESTVGSPFVEFEFRFVRTGTYTTYNLNSLIASYVDVDGNNTFQEFNQVSLPDSYTVDLLRDITPEVVGNMLKVNGANVNTNGVSNQNPRINLEATYSDISLLTFRFGADGPGGFDTGINRQAGIQFTCLTNFLDPQTFYPTSEYLPPSAPPENGVVYPNPVTDILFIQQDTPLDRTIEILDITGNPYYSQWFAAGATQPIEIDVSSYPEGYYFVIITADTGGSEEYTIFKQ